MKALLINGSPRRDGNTQRALSEVAQQLEKQGVECEIVWIGVGAMQGCIACGWCSRMGRCTYNDQVYMKVFDALKEADAVVVGSPTYYGGPNGSLCSLLDRVFYSAQRYLQNKVWGSVVVARRGGATTTFQRLNMYAQMSNMVVATSQYWNLTYGATKGECEQDKEGMQTMRTLADNVAWLMKSLKDNPAPEREPIERYNVVR